MFALVAAFLLTRAVGQRHPGQTITGNSQVAAAGRPRRADPGPALAAAAEGAAEELRRAHRVRRATCSRTHDYTDAIHEFGAAARLDPSQPEPPTYAGWAGALLAQQVKDPQTRQPLLAASLERINEVIKAHPKYPTRTR